MKKVSFIVSMFFVCAISFAQKHAMFLDVPIDGVISEFENSLVNLGYIKSNKQIEYYNVQTNSYEGQYLDYKLSSVHVIYSNQSNHVLKVVVDLRKYINHQEDIIKQTLDCYGPDYRVEETELLGTTWIWDKEESTVLLRCQDEKHKTLEIHIIDKLNMSLYGNEYNSNQELRVANEHLHILGIPIEGTIDEFHSKFTQKGMKPSSLITNTKKGTRCYEGHFFNEETLVSVEYDPKTKMVYRVKVGMSNAQMWADLVKSYMEKYGSENIIFDHVDPADCMNGLISQMSVCIEEGTILLQYTALKDKSLFITIEYTDKKNYEFIKKEQQIQRNEDI